MVFIFVFSFEWHYSGFFTKSLCDFVTPSATPKVSLSLRFIGLILLKPFKFYIRKRLYINDSLNIYINEV